jgi:membrane protein implicated in regulation of membrane protease activity
VKPFAIYTAMRLGMFLACLAVFSLIYIAAFGTTGALLWPFLAAIVVSAFLSWRFLAPQRERLAAHVQARAERATARFEEMRAKEDVEETSSRSDAD